MSSFIFDCYSIYGMGDGGEKLTRDQGLSVISCSKYIDRLVGQTVRYIEKLWETLLWKSVISWEGPWSLSEVLCLEDSPCGPSLKIFSPKVKLYVPNYEALSIVIHTHTHTNAYIYYNAWKYYDYQIGYQIPYLLSLLSPFRLWDTVYIIAELNVNNLCCTWVIFKLLRYCADIFCPSWMMV